MVRDAKIEAWIKAGYKLLGAEGLGGIRVERVARSLQLNKSGFYHYFGDTKAYMQQLGEHHLQLAAAIAEEISACKNIDPDVLRVIAKHRRFFSVECQLLMRGKQVEVSKVFDSAGSLLYRTLLPLWRRECDLPDDSVAALPCLNMARNFFYSRINAHTMDYEFLHGLANETRWALAKVVEEKSVPHQVQSN
jgi:AcrR family transcriptional regulator